MKSWLIVIMLLGFSLPARALPPDGLVYDLKMSVVKIFVVDKFGNHGVGSGIVVAEDHVATNCHVIANARGVHVIKFGASFAPVALKADWKHDLCLLRFEKLGITPVRMASSKHLKYAQPVFTIGFPNGVMVPLTSFGEVEALYPLDGANIIRASAHFRLGSSGGPIFDDTGALIGLTTLKSPGRNAFYYSIPSDWITPLLDQPEVIVAAQKEPPFWDTPEESRPYFMRVVHPLKTENWAELESISRLWVEQQPESVEAWYLLGLAEQNLGKLDYAATHLEKSLGLNALHIEARLSLDQIKKKLAAK
ncbi:Periplasmic pH-dependent serine endoprotease DegQ [Methylophilaceae bacterium]|nr:Periplasmic pH-dependent serine endoprotease DegQ [Methylophilaceae bacterium]